MRFPETRSDDEDAPPAFQVVLVARSSKGFGLPGTAMGAILEKEPARNTVFVFLPAVLNALRHTLPLDMKMVHDSRKARILAIALGRVAAHEIAHAIDGDLPHGAEDSLMGELLTPQKLQQHRLTFDERTAKRLRDGVGRLPGGFGDDP